MFENLTDKLQRVFKNLRGEGTLTEENIADALREIRVALLEADVNLSVVRELTEHIREKAVGSEVLTALSPSEQVVKIVRDELISVLGKDTARFKFASQPPTVILMAGLQGSGKTTTSGKLAKLLRDQQKKKVLLVSCDVYRPAAIEQLRTLAKQLEVDFFSSDVSQKPQDIALAALDFAKRHYHDVLIVDTAGRLAIDEAMMAEIKQLHAALKPIETLFVVDAMTGQDAVNTAKAFGDALPLTGIILTKLDGDARGGAALSVRQITGKPIKFVGVSEKPNGLEAFHPERMASRVLGMGDVLSLIEDAQREVDHGEAEKLAKKMQSGKGFDLNDFKMQIVQMRKMGGMSAMMDKLPAQLSQAAAGNKVDDKQIARTEGIINSMTPLERSKPELIKASRKRRIAMGAGVQVMHVNQLLNQFEQMQKMMKMFSKGGMGKLMRGMAGKLPGMR